MTSIRVRPAVRRFAIAACIVLVPVSGHAIWDYVELRRLVSEVDRLKSKGEPVSRRQLVQWDPGMDRDEQAAGRYYQAAAALAFRDHTLSHSAASLPMQSPARLAVNQVGSSRAISPEAVARLASLTNDYSDALEMMDRATRLPFVAFSPHPDEDHRRTYALEDLALVNAARTIAAASTGDAKAAAESLRGSLRLRRAHTRFVPWIGEPILELQVVLEHTQPPADMLTELQQHFQERETPDAVETQLRADRARLIQDVLLELYGRGADPLVQASNFRWSWRPLLTRPWFVHGFVSHLREQLATIEAAVVDWPEKLRALDEVAARHPSSESTIMQFQDPGAARHAASLARSSADRLTQLRSSRVALAVERFRREHGGALPIALNDLVPDYLASVPADPFSGSPLRYRVAPGVYAVYSIGRDGTDDGGQIAPLGFAPAPAASKDIGVEIRTR